MSGNERLDLDAIERRIPKEYDAPWHFEYQPASADLAEGWLVGYATGNPHAGLVARVPDYGERLAEFIVHARTDVPALLTEVAALRERAEKAEGQATYWEKRANAAWDRMDEEGMAIVRLVGEREKLRAQLAAVEAERDEARRERDLAIAHDRQPYPTADAYERVCEALRQTKAERDGVRDELTRMAGDLDDAHATLAQRDRTIRRVREIHAPFDAEDGHTRCRGHIAGYDPRTGDLVFAMWPCQTAQALALDSGTTEPSSAGSVDAGPASGAVPTGVGILPCSRCGSAPVAKPGESQTDGRLTLRARYCDRCIDRCHESTDFGHECVVCGGPQRSVTDTHWER